MLSPGKGIGLLEDFIGKAVGRQFCIFANNLRNASRSEKFAAATLGIADAVGIEHDDVVLLENQRALVVGRLGENSKRKPCERHFFAGAGVAKQTLLLTCVGDAETATLAIPGGETERHEAAL